jgi:hypothetical protein
LRREEALNTGAQIGASGSSGLAGGQASINSQAAGELVFNARTEGLGNSASKALQKAANLNSLGNVFKGVAGVGSTVFNNSNSISNFLTPSPNTGPTAGRFS